MPTQRTPEEQAEFEATLPTPAPEFDAPDDEPDDFAETFLANLNQNARESAERERKESKH